MNKREFKQAVKDLVTTTVSTLTLAERIALLKRAVVEVEAQNHADETNKGQPWTDDELRVILRAAPTQENTIAFAKTFRRGFGSIEQIYRWAARDQATVDNNRPDDKFIAQIKRVAREVGWRGT
jgi:hypothetical protein